MKRPMTVWDRIRRDGMQPQLGDVLRLNVRKVPGNERFTGVVAPPDSVRPLTVNKVSGEVGKSLDSIAGDHPLAGTAVAFYYNDGDAALDNGDCWEYVSRADGGPVLVDAEDAPGGKS